MNKWGALLDYLLHNYTYRQRFLFLALIFFITLPYCAYWLLRTESSWINYKEEQIRALVTEDKLARLVYLLLNNTWSSSTSKSAITESTALVAALRHSLSHFAQPQATLLDPVVGSRENISAFIKQLLEVAEYALNAILEEKNLSPSSSLSTIQSLATWIQDWALASGLVFDTGGQEVLLVSTAITISQLQAALSQDSSQQIAFGYIHRLHQEKERLQSLYRSLQGDLEATGLLAVQTQQTFLRYQIAQEDVINNITTTIPPEELESLLQASENWRNSQTALTFALLQKQLDFFIQLKKITWLFLLINILSILGCIFFRVLTKHLLLLIDHLEALARGDFSTRYYASSKDAFAKVGLTINAVAHTLADLSGRIQSLGMVLTESSSLLAYEVRTQEANVLDQETSIRHSTQLAAKIADNCQHQADLIVKLSRSALEQPLTQNTETALERMTGTMTQLTGHSHSILNLMQTVQKLLEQADGESSLMERVSNEARQLALNAAIETSHSSEMHQQRHKITYAIQRFSEDTAEATANIRAILCDTTIHLKTVEDSVTKGLQIIDAGNRRLKQFKEQLSSIAKQTNAQSSKFTELEKTIHQQAKEANDIIASVQDVHKNAQTATLVFEQLSLKVKHLDHTSAELKHLLNHFFSPSSSV